MLLLLMLLLLDATSWLTWNIRHNLVQIVVAFSGLTCLYVCKEIPPSFGPSSSAAVVIAPRRWQQKRTHYQFAFPWPPRIFCFGAAYVSGIKETAPGETPRSRLKRRIVEVEEEEEGRRRSVQSDALERARNWGTFSHLYHYYYYQLPSKQARQRTDGRTVAAAAWGGLESREAVFATTAVSFNDTKILAQKLHEMLRRLELALWSNDYYFYEAASSKRHCIPPVEFQQSW